MKKVIKFTEKEKQEMADFYGFTINGIKGFLKSGISKSKIFAALLFFYRLYHERATTELVINQLSYGNSKVLQEFSTLIENGTDKDQAEMQLFEELEKKYKKEMISMYGHYTLKIKNDSLSGGVYDFRLIALVIYFMLENSDIKKEMTKVIKTKNIDVENDFLKLVNTALQIPVDNKAKAVKKKTEPGWNIRLAEVREQKGMKQQKVANAIEMSISQYNHYELGRGKSFPVKFENRLAAVFEKQELKYIRYGR